MSSTPGPEQGDFASYRSHLLRVFPVLYSGDDGPEKPCRCDLDVDRARESEDPKA